MKKLTLAEFEALRKKAKIMKDENPSLRYGQCLFNVLEEEHADLADSVRNTNSDPFYADDSSDPRIVNFFKVIVDHH